MDLITKMMKNAVESLTVCLIIFTLSASVGDAQQLGQLPTRSAGAPDVQVIVLSDSSGNGVVNVTYPNQAGKVRLSCDIAALTEELNLNPATIQITNKCLPMQYMKTPIMTSVTFSAPNAVPLNTGALPVNKLILALRTYHRLAITYFMPSNYQYNGFTRYSNQNVEVSLLESGSAYSFSAVVNNPNFTTLTFPSATRALTDSKPAILASRNRKLAMYRTGGFIFVSACALLIGWGVYCAMSKLH
jgi:hypothetical protein